MTMAAMVQTYPQQSGTTTMLQTRPNTSSGIMPGHNHSQSQPNLGSQQYMANPQSYRNSFNIGGQANYRGSSVAPIQPYAFTSTPTLMSNGQWQSYGPCLQPPQMMDPNGIARPRHHSTASMTNIPNSTSAPTLTAQGFSRDDSSLPPANTRMAGSSSRPTFAQTASSRATPERYRRPSPRYNESASNMPQQTPQAQGTTSTGVATVVQVYNPRTMGDRRPSLPRTSSSRPHSAYGSMVGIAADDMQVRRQVGEEEMKRFRRRSMHSFDASDYIKPLTPQELKKQAEESFGRNGIPAKDQNTVARIVPVPLVEKNHAASHSRNGSSESIDSSRSSSSRPSSSTNRNSNASAPTTSSPASTSTSADEKTANPDHAQTVDVPQRSSSSDAVGKRVHSPSPLSKSATMASESSPDDSASSVVTPSPAKAPGSSHGSTADSPAAKQLAAINEKGGRPKSKTSRLRRAFSFSSAAEFKKAASKDAPSDDANPAAPAQIEPSKLRKEQRPEDVYEEEQERIAKKQEASGLGNSIYAGTKLFSGSTDNLSISSTASSASIMLRKMGKGMKKGGRSLVGLFRPKSHHGHGAPSPEPTIPEATQATVSMITAEAERDRVNVNTNEDLDKPSGETKHPHLERNSMDAENATRTDSLTSDNSNSRRSIVGGEKDRAEVLATIRKGILKNRSNSPSPSPRAQDSKGQLFDLPAIPNVTDSPSSSAPSTPNDETPGYKRNGSVAIGNEDYFTSALRLRGDSKSTPGTPHPKRCATFSPRIVFYDTWPSQEYDRRGDIATCNRLTPMLAQQIKEELNSFKMEMEVHETSKIYTHFF